MNDTIKAAEAFVEAENMLRDARHDLLEVCIANKRTDLFSLNLSRIRQMGMHEKQKPSRHQRRS